MHIKVYSIEKSEDENIKSLIDGYIKMSSKYAQVENKIVFNKEIAKMQNLGTKEAQNSYTKAYNPFLKSGYSIGLDVEGDTIDSFEFAKILENNSSVDFFIGGAFGLEKGFLGKTQRNISLSRITYAHKIAKLVLFEQIYRGLCINNNHPYHK